MSQIDRIDQIDQNKLPPIIQACVGEVRRIAHVIGEGRSRFNQYISEKQQFDSQRTDYWSKVNAIEARNSSGEITHTRKLYEIAALNRSYPDKVINTDRFAGYPDLPPLFTAWANISCLNCNNTFATNNLDQAELKLNQAINCIINKVKQEYPEALSGGTGNGDNGNNVGNGNGNDGTGDPSGTSMQTKYLLIGGALLIFLLVMAMAVGIIVII